MLFSMTTCRCVFPEESYSGAGNLEKLFLKYCFPLVFLEGVNRGEDKIDI